MATVVVGMSGGVDSSVAALLLKEQGHQVIGLFMKNWDEATEGGDGAQCTAEADYADVARVCDHLGISYFSVEFVKEYWNQVFERFLADYQQGLTPNPDILCNREIKFRHFYDKAKLYGADYLATGHYCQIGPNGELLRGADAGKDQTYFVYTLKADLLKNILFPIGHLQKSEVREIAKKAGLPTHSKKDSTGICFIGERKFRSFLSHYIQAKPGLMKTLAGETVGQHQGIAFYTLGQRKGLGLGGEGEPWFVVAKEIQTNTLYVERGDAHPALYASELWVDELSFVRESNFAYPLTLKCTAKARYRQTDQPCTVTFLPNSTLHVVFDQPQRALTPGQALVLYQGVECLGGGTIRKVGPTLFESQNGRLVI